MIPIRWMAEAPGAKPVQPTATVGLPAGVRAWEIDENGTVLHFAGHGSGSPPPWGWLRFTIAREVEDQRTMVVTSARRGLMVGRVPVRYACVFQSFELALDAQTQRLAREEGLRLAVTPGEAPLWIIAPGGELGTEEPALAPHLLGSDSARGDWAAFEATLASRRSLQPFNWIEGCVLDGLRVTPGERAEQACAAHLDYFFQEDGRLSYLGPRSEPRLNEIFGLEAVLPFAVLAARRPGHRALGLVDAFVARHADETGLIVDRGVDAEGRTRPFTDISIEAVYTVAYPLAVLSRAGRPEWGDLAIRQMAERRRLLTGERTVWQRSVLGGAPAQRNWARACGWYVLGAARTFEALGSNVPSAEADAFVHLATWLETQQRPDGLWNVYVEEAETGPDTSGSASIAAGLALGHRLGLLTSAAAVAAQRMVAGAEAYLRPDGMLGGVAQLNRGGDSLQRSGYRVLAPFAMGLLAQARHA